MQGTFMDEYRQVLALEKITAEPKKQFFNVQSIDAQTTKESLDIELAEVQAKIQNLKYELKGQSRGHRRTRVTNKPHSNSNNNQVIITNTNIV